MARIFKDDRLQQQFELKGYVVVPFLAKEDVAHLKALYHHEFSVTPGGFYSTSFSEDETVKNKLAGGVEEIFDKQAAEVFLPFRKLGSCFLNKAPGPEGEMPIHQDWTVVDEPAFDSVTIWVPLCDVNDTNGAMQVLDGSHRFSTALRSPSLQNPFINVQAEIRNDLKTINMKAGEAIIFSQALLHASPPNLTGDNRLVVTYGLIPEKAQLLFYHKNENGKIEKYQVPDNFFRQYNTQIGAKPQVGNVVEELDAEAHLINASEYRQMKNEYLKRMQSTYKMKPLFKDETKQQFFEREGYVVFPLLNEAEVNDLKQYYESLHIKDEKGFGFHVSMDQSDKDMCRKVREKIWGAALPRLDEHLKDFKPFVSSFVVKESNPKGVVPAHQDWSFVDKEEDGYCSVTCWITLVETNIDNGAMGVIRGSHKMMQSHRPSPSPQTPVPLSDHMFSIFPYLKTIDMKPGEVLMFDNRTFHASPPNTTDGIRLAAGVGVTQKDAQLVHYYLRPNGTNKTILKYKVDPDFFLKYENATLAKMFDRKELIQDYELLEEVPYHFTQYTADELIALIKDAGNEFNVPMCEKLSKLFGYNMDGTAKQPEPVTASTEKEIDAVLDKAIVEAEEEVKKPFFEVYTPYNVLREIKFRLTGK